MLQIPRKKTKIIQFRITSPQYERLLNMVQAKGCTTLSEYLRRAALEKDLLFEIRFEEMYNKIMKKKTETARKVKTSYPKQDFLI